MQTVDLFYPIATPVYTMLSHAEPEPNTDADLVRRALAGNRLAARQLTERYRRTVYAIALRALGNADDAQDVSQEALVYAYQRLTDVRDAARFPGWIRNVTLSLCTDYRRRRGTRRLGESIPVFTEASEERDYVQRLAIRTAVENLSETHRETLLLHYVGGWSQEEIAALMAVSINTVRSRLMAAKQRLRTNLRDTYFVKAKTPFMSAMPAKTGGLTATQRSRIETAFPGAHVLEIQNDIEPWMPFAPRVRLTLADGSERTVDFRHRISADHAALIPALEQAGIPCPRLIGTPILTDHGWLVLSELPRGENLTLWTLGGTPHRIRIATERAIEGIDRLQAATDILLAAPVGATLPRRTLLDELAILTEDKRWNADPWLAEEGKERHGWLRDPWFAAAITKLESALQDIRTPLVYTDYPFFFPQEYRIAAGDGNPLVEFTEPFGHFGDPLLGLAMVWVYDCYPFVHTGFVEQFLWRRGVSQREFAPRLALKALQMMARDLPVVRPADGDGGEYWDTLRGWAEKGLGGM